ncbi:nucleoside-diphosphate kinase [Enterococcus sp. DIV2402]|uniref:Nucleoside diphosphate kinase n=1 Tax=Candidatus Enterococcus lowellii TaxID=2230877 RepID=A0ABZ2SJ44_9ENTE|nr:nucleoside-diphosphate kinase [Enterococcus sp. DIV2402]MBO0465212.1 nucleoside-diphosphate kinase [Enterococcus sp. DIV2402]
MEQTLVIIKPDGVERQLVGSIIQRFEAANLKMKAVTMTILKETVLNEHYSHLINQPFFPKLVAYMTEGPVLLLILEGEQAVTRVRRLIGATDPLQADIGTIRGDYGVNQTRNLVHASDSPEAAQIEIARFFGK